MDPEYLFTSLRYDLQLLTCFQNPEWSNAGWNWRNKSAFYMLDFHRDRMLRGARYWRWESVVDRLVANDALQDLERLILEKIGEHEAKTEKLGGNPSNSLNDSLGDNSGEIAYYVKVQITRENEVTVLVKPVPYVPLARLYPRSLSADATTGSTADGQSTEQHTHNGTNGMYTVLVDTCATQPSAYTHFKTDRRQVYTDAFERLGVSLGSPNEVLLVNEAGHIMEGCLTTPYFYRNGRWVTPTVPIWNVDCGGRTDGSQDTGEPSKTSNKHDLSDSQLHSDSRKNCQSKSQNDTQSENQHFRSDQSSHGHRDDGGQDGTTRRWALAEGNAVEGTLSRLSIREGETMWISNGVRGFIPAKVIGLT